jgi:lipopolysaccharide exporter
MTEKPRDNASGDDLSAGRDMAPGLFNKVVKGGMWISATRVAVEGLSFGRWIVLTHLLLPADFGMLGIAMLSISILNTFSSTGFQDALIRKKGDITTYLDSAWTAGIIRTALLAAILYFSAPYVAVFFNQPDKPLNLSLVTLVIRVMAVSLIIDGLANIGTIYFAKELAFHKRFINNIGGTIADIIVTLSLALVYRNVLALVAGKLAGSIIRVVISYVIHPYRPGLGLNREKIKELWHFGRWVTGSGILGFLNTQGDDIFLGKMFGLHALGLYQMSYKLSMLSVTEITNVIGGVTFSAYSKIQTDIPRLRDAYLKVLQFTTFLTIPVAGLTIVFMPDFARLFMSEKWLYVIPLVQILTLAGLCSSIGSTTAPLFLATGKPYIVTAIAVVKLIILAGLIYPLSASFGTAGVAWAVAINTVVVQMPVQYVVGKVICCRLRVLIRLIALPILATMIVSGIILALKYLLFNACIGIGDFVILVITAVLSYCGIAYLLDRWFHYGIKKILMEQVVTLLRKS